jgi:hypothetical protein
MQHIKHTARYQLSRFLQSDESFNLPLDGKDVSILTTIFDFMDSGDEECCFAKLTLICKNSRVPRSTVIERIKKFIKFNLLIKVRKSYMNNYYIGSSIKIDVLQPDMGCPVAGLVMSGNGTLYNNIDKNSYKKAVATPEKPKNHKQEPSSKVESQTTSSVNITEKRQKKGSPLFEEACIMKIQKRSAQQWTT